jgi:hypothetical protein
LAETTAEIASCGAKGKDARAGIKMVERFFFDGVDTKPGGPTPTRHHELATTILSNETKTALPIFQPAFPGA